MLLALKRLLRKICLYEKRLGKNFGVKLEANHFLPRELHEGFSRLFSRIKSNATAQSEHMRFEDLRKCQGRTDNHPGRLQKKTKELEKLHRSCRSDRAAATEEFAFLFWPGKSKSDEGYLVRIFDLLKSLEMGLLGSSLSPAEAALTLHLVIGYGLNEASSLRPNSHEANRSCLKTVYEKVGCNDQGSLIVKAYASLIHTLSSSKAPSSKNSTASEIFSEANFGTFEIHEVIVRDYEVVCIELGPKDGKPVILHHATRVPYLTELHVQALHKAKIRFLMLLRPGCISSGPAPKTVEEQRLVMDEATNLFVSLAGGPQVATVVGHANGSAFALSAAKRLLDLKDIVLFLPSSPNSGGGTGYGNLLSRLSLVARDSDLIIETYVRSLIGLIRNDWAFDLLVKHLHSDSSLDSSEILLELGNPKTKNFFRRAYQSSSKSIILDVKAGLEIDQSDIGKIRSRPRVFLGDQSGRISNFNDVRLHRLQGVGEYASSSAWLKLFDALSDHSCAIHPIGCSAKT